MARPAKVAKTYRLPAETINEINELAELSESTAAEALAAAVHDAYTKRHAGGHGTCTSVHGDEKPADEPSPEAVALSQALSDARETVADLRARLDLREAEAREERERAAAMADRLGRIAEQGQAVAAIQAARERPGIVARIRGLFSPSTRGE